MKYKVSVIIPFQKETDYLAETLEALKRITHKNVEVILLSDGPMGVTFIQKHLNAFPFSYKIIETGPVSPAVKRDRGAECSSGEILAFIDDDAYPAPDWLDKALPYFSDEQICAAGGPQLTPPNDGLWEKISGAVFLSPLNGAAVCRYWPEGKPKSVDDWPSVNLLVRKADFIRVGGFNSEYWPGEDTKLCLDLVKLGKKIMYVPEMIVYHHRRRGFRRHMRQVGNYGLHRGFFAKKYPDTSLKVMYFLPACFFLFIIFGWILIFMKLSAVYYFLWVLYVTALIVSTVSITKKVKSLMVSLGTVPYLVGTHFWYGFRFLQGFLCKSELKSKLGR